MASTVFATRNHHQQSYMGEIPNYSNNNPNPNQKPKSNKKKHFPNGRLHNHNPHAVDSTQAASDDAYSFNQRPIDTGHVFKFNQGAYVTYNVSSCSRSEINELRRKLTSDLERIRSLNDRIQAGDLNLNPRSVNGKLKKLASNKRPFGSELKHVNGGGDENLMKMCRQVLTKLMKHKHSWVFNVPVDAVGLGLHDYHQIVKRPMDLGSVKLNLSRSMYSSPLDFAEDVRLVFENALLYNPKTDKVHGMADQLLQHFEGLFRPIQAKLGTFSHANAEKNEFSVVNELDGSSWDDVVQSPVRSKKLKASEPIVVHSPASNPIIPPVVQQVQVQSPARTPSPILAAEPEPVKPLSVPTALPRVVVPKLPKPRAKDLNKREMNMEEKQKLGLGLQSMPPEKMPQLLQIIRKRNDQLAQEGDEIELDIEALDTETLWELDRFVTNWKKLVSKTKRQALLVNGASADIDDVPLGEKMDGVKKAKKEAGEEDVDIGDEMPESSFPHLEIEKDDGGGGHGQAAGHGNDNASGSSSGSSSSSSDDSSSSSDSDSGSSSGSDSDADNAQS